MKLLDKIPKLLTNDELRAVLIEEVGAGEAEGKEAPAAVVQALQYLEGCNAKASREQLQSAVAAIQPLKLVKSEVLQLINLRPAAPVEIHLVVEQCEERLTTEQVEELITTLQTHLGGPPAGIA